MLFTPLPCNTQVSLDACLVLSGSVLTSYVGVVGLARRMAQDKNLPSVLLGRNRLFGTNHTIIFGFFGVCWALFRITGGNVLILGSVYALAFLCVMGLFALGSVALRQSQRQEWTTSDLTTVSLAIGAVLVAIFVNTNIFLTKITSSNPSSALEHIGN